MKSSECLEKDCLGAKTILLFFKSYAQKSANKYEKMEKWLDFENYILRFFFVFI